MGGVLLSISSEINSLEVEFGAFGSALQCLINLRLLINRSKRYGAVIKVFRAQFSNDSPKWLTICLLRVVGLHMHVTYPPLKLAEPILSPHVPHSSS